MSGYIIIARYTLLVSGTQTERRIIEHNVYEHAVPDQRKSRKVITHAQKSIHACALAGESFCSVFRGLEKVCSQLKGNFCNNILLLSSLLTFSLNTTSQLRVG